MSSMINITDVGGSGYLCLIEYNKIVVLDQIAFFHFQLGSDSNDFFVNLDLEVSKS